MPHALALIGIMIHDHPYSGSSYRIDVQYITMGGAIQWQIAIPLHVVIIIHCHEHWIIMVTQLYYRLSTSSSLH